MTQINEIIDKIKNMGIEGIIDIWIAIAIVIVFRIFSGTVAYIIIKMFKFKEKNSKKIKNNAFYDPLRSFFFFLGIYLAVLFLSTPFNISQEVMNVVTRIFKIVIIITTAVALANSITTKSAFIKKMQAKTDKSLDKHTLKILIKAIKIVIYVIAGFLVITELGFNLNGLIAGLGIGSLAVTLAAQDTIKNFFGGLTLVLDKPLKIGDYIIINNIEGTVEDIGFRTTKVRTIDNSLLYVPNAVMVASAFVNCSQKTKNRYRNIISLDLNNDLEKIERCKAKILEMLNAHEMVQKEDILIKFTAISSKGIDILVDCFVNTVEAKEFLDIKEDINYKIVQIFNNEGVKLSNGFQNVKS